jgi:hypothetical protein
MTELNVNPVRAKKLYIEGARQDKYGNRKPAKVRLHEMPMAGTYSAKEAERLIPEMAERYGVSEDRVKLETYKRGEAPLETNPRHRGLGDRWSRPRGDTVREIPTGEHSVRVRRVFQGGIPQTPEEWQAHSDEFYQRQTAQRSSPA